jgi:hypothetical protein
MNYRVMKLGKVGMMLAGAAVLGATVMLLWNWIMPSLFAGSQPLDYWRALGLLVLCRILFGGLRGRGGWRHGHERWQRWQAMTPEERAQFHQHRSEKYRPHQG